MTRAIRSVAVSEFVQGNQNPLIPFFVNLVPILNGRDPTTGDKIFWGPQGTKIHRYLFIAFIAKSLTIFNTSHLAKEIDNSIYFTIYGLGRVAAYFESLKPFRTPIHYDRTTVAKRIYEMISKRGWVDIKKHEGETYITTTEKGDEVCNKMLQEMVAIAEASSRAPTLMKLDLSPNTYMVKKGGAKTQFLRDNANLKMLVEKLADDILEINLSFKDEIKSLEEDSEEVHSN
jgi:hypothetical protein